MHMNSFNRYLYWTHYHHLQSFICCVALAQRILLLNLNFFGIKLLNEFFPALQKLQKQKKTLRGKLRKRKKNEKKLRKRTQPWKT